MSLRLLAALAVALAVLPSAAAEPEADCPRDDDRRGLETPLPDVPAARVAPALDGLQRLRLHPGRDGFEVSEAARRHPQVNGK